MHLGISAGVYKTRRRIALTGVLIAPLAWALSAGPARAGTPNNQTVSTHMNHVAAITLTGTGLASGPTWDIDLPPGHGTLSRNGAPDDNTNPKLRYTPDADFSGNDSFTFTIHDDVGTSQPGTVTIHVTRPVADDQSLSTNED